MGARFVEKCSRFEGALSGADDEDLLVSELTEVSLLGSVRDQGCGKTLEHLWSIGERLDTPGDHDPPRMYCFAILQSEPVTARR